MSIVDTSGVTIKVEAGGMVKVDGILVFKTVNRNGIIYVQFCDHDRMRSRGRGSRYVEVPLEVLNSVICPPPPIPVSVSIPSENTQKENIDGQST